MIYSIMDDMTRIDVPVNHEKNSLEIGRVLHLNGYNDPDYVIVKNLGISEYSQKNGYGATYLTVSLDDMAQSQQEAYSLKYIKEKQDGRIQTYIMDEVKTPDEVLEIWEKSEAKRKSVEISKNKAEKERLILVEKGKELYNKYIPDNAKSLIMACHEIDDCDTMTDYFSTVNGELVVLGWSTHKRDIFSEMRKHAGKIEETKHLAIKGTTDRDGQERTEDNKEWWTPGEEHREKYSMGNGYYLKNANRYSTGWKVYKSSYYMACDEIYISLAKRCVFTDKGSSKQVIESAQGVTIQLNEDKAGIEVLFPGKPSEAIRTALKEHGFRWSRGQGLWYAKQSESRLAFVETLKAF